MSRRLMLIAFHFPPIQGSTGVTRTLAFAKYLRAHGWSVLVLTVDQRAYDATRSENEALVPEGVEVARAWALDARRHFSVFGRYPQVLALPDRWQSWIIGGLVQGVRLARRWRPDVLMSTFPIASAHCIAYCLNRFTGVPWVAEFRDPMAQSDYPADALVRSVYRRIEARTFGRASRIVVTTAGCADAYADRYPSYPRDSIVVIPNGFDDEMFQGDWDLKRAQSQVGKLRFLHSGLLYADDRNPAHLFQALAELRREGQIDADDLSIEFRGSGNEEAYEQLVQSYGLEGLVSLLPSVPYREALAEMKAAHALLLLQGSSCNHQIPAKLYEYLYCQRPILGLTDPKGDTAREMNRFGLRAMAPLDDTTAIKELIVRFVADVRAGCADVADRREVLRFSRKALTSRLSDTLDAVVSGSKRG